MSEPFRVIVADPPWQFDDKLPGEKRGAEKHYSCMSTYDVCRLADWGDRQLTIMEQPVARDAVLFLWRVASMQQAALDVALSWDFRVKTELVWLKKTANGFRWFGMGRITRAEHEVCLIATRGNPVVKDHSVSSTFFTDLDADGLTATVGRHSEKPEAFYDVVETLFDGPYLELFSRKRRPNWTCIGDELEVEA